MSYKNIVRFDFSTYEFGKKEFIEKQMQKQTEKQEKQEKQEKEIEKDYIDIILYFDVEYKQKETAKIYKLRWEPKYKLWFYNYKGKINNFKKSNIFKIFSIEFYKVNQGEMTEEFSNFLYSSP